MTSLEIAESAIHPHNQISDQSTQQLRRIIIVKQSEVLHFFIKISNHCYQFEFAVYLRKTVKKSKIALYICITTCPYPCDEYKGPLFPCGKQMPQKPIIVEGVSRITWWTEKITTQWRSLAEPCCQAKTHQAKHCIGAGCIAFMDLARWQSVKTYQ